MRAKLYLTGVSYFEAAIWCRRNGIPIIAAKSFRHGEAKWIGKVFYYGSRRVIEEVIDRFVREHGPSMYYVLLRERDFDIVKLRFGMLVEGWRND